MSTDLETRLSTTLTRVADATPIPPSPALDPASEPRRHSARTPRFARRRVALAGIAAVAVFGGGLSIAAAAGVPVIPGPVARALGWTSTPGTYHADLSTTRKILTVPGPEGTPLTLWYSDASDNGYCVMLTTTVTVDSSAPGGFTEDARRMPRNGAMGGGCGSKSEPWWHQFGGAGSGGGNGASQTFVLHVPGADSVRVQFADGTSRPLPLADDWTAGWMTHAQATKHPIVVGYTAAGTVMGRFDLTRFAVRGRALGRRLRVDHGDAGAAERPRGPGPAGRGRRVGGRR